MAIRIFAGALFVSTLATGAFAQDCTNPLNAGNAACIGFGTQPTTISAGATTTTATGVTGFIPLGAGVAPVALGIGAVVTLGVGRKSSSTTSTD